MTDALNTKRAAMLITLVPSMLWFALSFVVQYGLNGDNGGFGWVTRYFVGMAASICFLGLFLLLLVLKRLIPKLSYFAISLTLAATQFVLLASIIVDWYVK